MHICMYTYHVKICVCYYYKDLVNHGIEWSSSFVLTRAPGISPN